MTNPHQPAVSVTGLRKRFGNLEVLKGISLEAREGDVVSILGSSGSGKSTMLRTALKSVSEAVPTTRSHRPFVV
jgi:ABC-type histidine transport system ATPase subunit